MTERRTIALNEHDVVLHCAGTREALHAALLQLYEAGKQQIAAAGPDPVDLSTGEIKPRTWRLTFGEDVEDVTLKQHRFYRGPVLGQIAKQGRQDGRVWEQKAWHGLFKRVLLGYEVVREQVAGRARPTVYRRLRSTADLSVKQMSEYIDEVIALATTELHVEFEFDLQEREAVRYRRPKRKPTTTAAPAANQEEETHACDA